MAAITTSFLAPVGAPKLVGMRVDSVGFSVAATQAARWALRGDSRYICMANAASVMEAHDSKAFLAAIDGADMVTPDGRPLVWGLKLLGARNVTQVCGPDLMPELLGIAARMDLPVAFYGSSEQTLERLLRQVHRRWPRLQVVYACAPPFRNLTTEEDLCVVDSIRRSGARLLFVGLGCPRQEMWMAAHRGRLPCVMLGVGAAFDFLAGTKPRAPHWMTVLGIEWFFRLCTEPRRLWKRYLRQNPRFIFYFALQLIGIHRNKRDVQRAPKRVAEQGQVC